MLNDVVIGQYFSSDSVIHNLDPRNKIILSVLYLSGIFIIKDFCGYLLLALLTIITIFLSKIPLKHFLAALKPVFFFMSLTVIINAFMTPGDDILFQFHFLTLTKEGIYFALFMLLRIFFIVISGSMLTLTTSPIQLTDGLESLMNPLKKVGFPAHEIAMMMSIALRFVPTLIEETDKIIKAQSARGADFESGNIVKRAKAMIPILIPLFISAFRRADELALAMECRCYQGGKGRTKMKQLRINRNDIIGVILMCCFVAALFFT